MINSEILLAGSKELGIDLDEDKIEKFRIYKDLLKEWNNKINITAITEDKEIIIKHFLDSITPYILGLFKGEKRVIDIGTGGGFPGLPLKIINQDLDVTLMDSLNKRIRFLQEVLDSLELDKIEAVHGRAEEVSRTKEYREVYDICISRAVASLDTLCEYCIPFVKPGGYFISMKGPDIDEELNQARNSIKILGGELVDKKIITIPESNIKHSLLVIKKTRETPTKYPRGGGKPKKNPL